MDKFLCVMAGFDDQTEKFLHSLQDKLYSKGFVGKQTKNIPIHITLGMLTCEKEAELVDFLKGTVFSMKSLEVEFHHIGIFAGGEVLFVAPDINRYMLELKELFGNSAGWTPHVTMLIDDTEIVLEAERIVLSEFKEFVGRVDKIYLYEVFPSRYIGCYMLKQLPNE